MQFYCEADGTGPATEIDWTARIARAIALDDGTLEGAAAADDARRVIEAEQLAHPSHMVRNGRGVRLASCAQGDELWAAVVACSGGVPLVALSSPDERGGVRVALPGSPGGSDWMLRCPECLAPVRWVE